MNFVLLAHRPPEPWRYVRRLAVYRPKLVAELGLLDTPRTL